MSNKKSLWSIYVNVQGFLWTLLSIVFVSFSGLVPQVDILSWKGDQIANQII